MFASVDEFARRRQDPTTWPEPWRSGGVSGRFRADEVHFLRRLS